MRGIYVIHDWKPNRPHIHKVGMTECIEKLKGEYPTCKFEPMFSRVYEINEAFELNEIQDTMYDQLERLGYKVEPEWFEVEVEKIDQCAIELFDDLTGLFKGALREFHLIDETLIERQDYPQTRDFAHEQCARYRWRHKKDWFDYSAELPVGIPRRPDRVYKNMGWTSWGSIQKNLLT